MYAHIHLRIVYVALRISEAYLCIHGVTNTCTHIPLHTHVYGYSRRPRIKAYVHVCAWLLDSTSFSTHTAPPTAGGISIVNMSCSHHNGYIYMYTDVPLQSWRPFGCTQSWVAWVPAWFWPVVRHQSYYCLFHPSQPSHGLETLSPLHREREGWRESEKIFLTVYWNSNR